MTLTSPQIAEIQGDGASTPFAGETVTTKGVVTASYPTGTFSGYYLQTPGTGGDVKTEGKSDGIFVYTARTTPPEIGDCLVVTGTASEYYTLTQLSGTTAVKADDCEPVTPYNLASLPTSDEEYEQYEGMLLNPQGPYTVAETYNLNSEGQILLANSDKPLPQSTDVALPGEQANAVEADNVKKQILLDDGTRYQFLRNNNHKNEPLPYIDTDHPIRVGASVEFVDGVVLDYRYNKWAFQPTSMQVGPEGSPVLFENTRTDAPAEVGGDIQIGTFNVLNYFVSLGEDEAGCKAYTDREGNPTTANYCTVRGAYNTESLQRQEAKIVKAINALDADVVALQEIENSNKQNPERDKALANLVDALNAAAGDEVWSYVASPAEVPNNGDAIRNAFIYQNASVAPVGETVILDEENGSAFVGVARSPMAQKFKTINAPEGKLDNEFVIITNHFKSKGSVLDGPGNEDRGDGQGANNAARVEQAKQLAAFGMQFDELPVFLVGDFNSYTLEDPMIVLANAGYTNLAANSDNYSYVYGGRVGSLDHIFANEAGAELMAGVDYWMINANEPVALEYSRYNYTVPLLYTDDVYRASDHNPAKLGLNIFTDEEGEEPTEPTEPTDPTEPTEPTEPSEPSEPSEPTEPTEPSEPSEPTDPSEPTEPSEPPEPSEPSEPTKPTEPSEPSDPSEPSETSEPSDTYEPTAPSEPTDASQPTEQPGKPSLPKTGVEVTLLALLGLGLAGLGAGAVVLRRRNS